MRVLHVIPDMQVGGAERMLSRLVPALRNHGIESAVALLRRDGPLIAALHNHKIPTFEWDLPRGFFSPSRHRSWRRFHADNRFDLVHGWMVHGNFASALIGRRRGLPIVWSVRQSHFYLRRHPLRTNLLTFLSSSLAGQADSIVFNSVTGRDMFTREHRYPSTKSSVIPNGFDTMEFAPALDSSAVRRELGIAADATVIGMIARYHPIKGFDVFCAAAVQILRERPDTMFLLCGNNVDRSNPAMAELTARDCLQGKVVLAGYRPDVAPILSAMDVLVSCSYSEAFSNTIGEAMSCGVVCVVSDAGDSAMLVGNTGRVVPVGSASAVAEACLALLALSPSERFHLGAQARQRIISDFSLDSAAARFASLYNSLRA
jgi:glycosyltransferase involved in cell wall biosynthesis